MLTQVKFGVSCRVLFLERKNLVYAVFQVLYGSYNFKSVCTINIDLIVLVCCAACTFC